MKTKFYIYSTLIFCLTVSTAAQSGGQFTIEKSVIAGGGGQSSTGGQFTVADTNAQSLAGQKAINAAFSVHAGFWNPDQFIPTAAEVTVGGRVTTANGRGIRNVRITITGANGQSRTTFTGTFGYFRFTEVPSGETYIITAVAKRYEFVEPSQVRAIVDDTDNINFVAVDD